MVCPTRSTPLNLAVLLVGFRLVVGCVPEIRVRASGADSAIDIATTDHAAPEDSGAHVDAVASDASDVDIDVSRLDRGEATDDGVIDAVETVRDDGFLDTPAIDVSIEVADVPSPDVGSGIDVASDGADAGLSGDLGLDTGSFSDVATDRGCGSCSAPNAASDCVDGTCRYRCLAGWGDCNGNRADGCETSVLRDATNCGACNAICLSTVCFAGACAARTCPSGMSLIPSGAFSMGSTTGDPDERPVRRVELAAFCIDVTEVTTASYASCPPTACSAPSLGASYNWGMAGRESHPINGVDWAQAMAFCRWRSGATLPTEAQWEYAARGVDSRVFPWGDTMPASQLCWSGSGTVRTGTCAIGSFPAGASPFGVLDMAGNVPEWTADWYAGYPSDGGTERNPSGPASGTSRVFRGGYWHSSFPSPVRAASRNSIDPAYRDYVGFRCALPGT